MTAPTARIPRALSRMGSLAVVLFLFHTHEPAQLVATARWARAHCADGDIENQGNLFISDAFEAD